ncbi:hypothetical protein [Pseudoalteromonas sp. A601]|uniref:hypothetical protein n=2 Tax=Pseudoalteromonas TaxID=53246 RepID=UPI0020CE26B2|nr:hypothetical protein [Pseudoalteromonas sp. A601]
MKKVVKSSPKLLVVVMSLLAAHVYAQNDEASSMQDLQRTATQWQAVTEQDIQYAYAQTAANHPGLFDKLNLDFPELLDSARYQALELAKQVTTPQAYAAAIARFNTQNHFYISWAG